MQMSSLRRQKESLLALTIVPANSCEATLAPLPDCSRVEFGFRFECEFESEFGPEEGKRREDMLMRSLRIGADVE